MGEINRKQIGRLGLSMAINYFTIQGYTVSLPINDTQWYDLIVEKQSKLYRVQVKGTSFKTKYGIYQVSLKSSGGTKGKIYKTVCSTDVELLFVVTKDLDKYLIPVCDIHNMCTLNLGKEYNKYLL